MVVFQLLLVLEAHLELMVVLGLVLVQGLEPVLGLALGPLLVVPLQQT